MVIADYLKAPIYHIGFNILNQTAGDVLTVYAWENVDLYESYNIQFILGTTDVTTLGYVYILLCISHCRWFAAMYGCTKRPQVIAVYKLWSIQVSVLGHHI